MTRESTDEFGEIFPEHIRQTNQMREINAEARKLAEVEALDGKLGFFMPPIDYDGLISELTKLREALCVVTGRFDPDVFRAALANFGVMPDIVRPYVIDARAEEVANARQIAGGPSA